MKRLIVLPVLILLAGCAARNPNLTSLQLEALCGDYTAAQKIKQAKEASHELLDILGLDPTRHTPPDNPHFTRHAEADLKKYEEQLQEEYESTTDPQRRVEIAGNLEKADSYLQSGTGRFGKLRQFPSDLENARRRVAKDIGTALDKIKIHNTELFDYLDSRIKKGARCCYTPDPNIPIDWDL